MPKPIPVSTLARFAADPDGFRSRRRTGAAAARHGIRWHERLASAPRPVRMGPWLAIAALAAALALVFTAG
ncbi:MAG: hypothetical protein OXD40_04695 [bacterium]|nr:hypothetical protein [bacterium]